MDNPRVVGIGQARIDHLALVDRYPDPDARIELAGLSLQGGGVVATALTTLATLGVKCGYLGKLADDDFGRFVIKGFEGTGIDASGVAIQPGRISPYSFVIVVRESGARTVLFTPGNVEDLAPDELDLTRLDGAALLVLDGYQVGVQVRAAEYARKQGITVVLDAGNVSEGMGELTALTDVLVASERYASEIAPRGELEDSLVELSRMGPQTVVVTLGEEGSIGLQGDKLVRQPPLNVEVADTTGAGDVFLGGYCYGVLKDLPLERCMQLASAAAGLSCRELGSRAGLPSLAEIEHVI